MSETVKSIQELSVAIEKLALLLRIQGALGLIYGLRPIITAVFPSLSSIFIVRCWDNALK
jgi:hypothetical protein